MGLILTYSKGLKYIDKYGSQIIVPVFTNPSDYNALFQSNGSDFWKSVFVVDKDGNTRCFPVINGGYKDPALSLNFRFNNRYYYAIELYPELLVSGNMTGQGVTDSQSGTTYVNITGISTREYYTQKSGIKVNSTLKVRIQGVYRNSVIVNSSDYTFPANTTSVYGTLKSAGISTSYTIRIAVQNTETGTWYYSSTVTRGKIWSKTITLGYN